MYAASSGAGLTTLYPVHNLELNEVQAEVLTRELHSIIQNDRYPLSSRLWHSRRSWGSYGRSANASPCHRGGITSRRARGDMPEDGSILCTALG
jgi:hypothetical protein